MKSIYVLAALALAVVIAGCAATPRDQAEVYDELDRLSSDPSERETTWYVMEAGDTLYGIARRFNTTVPDLQLLNPELGDPHTLSIGTRIRVPVSNNGDSRPADESRRTQPAPSGGGDLAWPIRGDVLAGFGDRVSDPSPRQNRGIDIAARRGEDVRAAGDGVAHILPVRHYGDVVLVDHGDGMSTFYGYVENIQIDMGDRVSRGDVLAKAGDKGRVHFRVMRGDDPVDPRRLLP